MSTQIFLGSPPPHIEAWIKANFKPKAKWVPAAYTNKWAFSDGNTRYITITGPNAYDFSTITEDEYNDLMQYTDGMTHFHIVSTGIPYENTIIGFSSYAEMKKTTELTFKLIDSSNPDLKCYRIYTPGHWEDANGNWINGSWDSETTMTAIYDPNDWKCKWLDDGTDQSGSPRAGWYGGEFLSDDRNASIFISQNAGEYYSWHRIWTNTVPEPNS